MSTPHTIATITPNSKLPPAAVDSPPLVLGGLSAVVGDAMSSGMQTLCRPLRLHNICGHTPGPHSSAPGVPSTCKMLLHPAADGTWGKRHAHRSCPMHLPREPDDSQLLTLWHETGGSGVGTKLLCVGEAVAV